VKEDDEERMTFGIRAGLFGAGIAVSGFLTGLSPVFAQTQGLSPFVRALAEAVGDDPVLAAHYRTNGYEAHWTDADDADRRQALLTALSHAGDHGLPIARYDAAELVAAYHAAQTEGDRGRLEARMTRALLTYAHDLQSGALIPADVDAGIKREIVTVDPALNLQAFLTAADPVAWLSDLPPQSPEYAQLVKAKITLERLSSTSGWGAPVDAKSLEPGQSGALVVALRDRLAAMGYLGLTATQDYDAAITRAVQAFQLDHGLEADGVADELTMAEINVGPAERLESVIVALERQRWMDMPRGKRHIWVNIPDFTAKIIDDGKVTFQTRSVVGKDVPDQRTPEFSDEMEYMVVNPSWSVPRSITVKEYLPMMQRNPGAAGHLQLIDRNGRAVSRANIDFAAYNARNFPYAMRQAPSDGNALGLVKFMFPNQYNIYLHDTPSKSLFGKEIRAFSHGCIRLADPFDFAHALLARQSQAAEEEFDATLKTGRETSVPFETHIPVHLVYFTAFPTAKGQMNYRRDVYGRDGRIFEALVEAGVAPVGVQG
jgi:L,D-transpeptidase YcbB